FAFDDRFDLIRAEHREHDGIATPREIGDRRSRLAAKLRELGIFDGIDVEANDLEAGVEQAMRESLAQQTDADKADWVAIAHEPHPSQMVANRRHVSHARAAYVIPRSRERRHEAIAPVTSPKRRDAEIARGHLETVAQGLGHGDAVLGAILPLEMALLPRQPDALDSRQPLGAPHGADRGVDLALECRRRRERFDRHRNDGMAGIGGLALLLDEIDDVAPERRLIE